MFTRRSLMVGLASITFTTGMTPVYAHTKKPNLIRNTTHKQSSFPGIILERLL